jgi:hypothetical protein
MPQVQIAAHQSHWYDIFKVILEALNAGNTVLANASIIPAPVEAGITIGIVAAATTSAVIDQAQAQAVVPATPEAAK